VRAWLTYWFSIGVAAILWIAVAIGAGRDGMREILHQPGWLLILVSPLVVAGLNLILFRESHEQVCRLETERHSWLRYIVGSGYSARTFGLTGLALLGMASLVIALQLMRS
jgi:hypothetical protein